MNESSLTQLKIIVERAVRTVRASTLNKRKMREELLAHVSGVFEEEFAHLVDERAALERTALRFGNPGELKEHLQQAIPKMDATERFFDWASFQPGETVLRRAVRYVVLIESYALLFLLAIWILSGQTHGLPTGIVRYIGSVLLGVGYLVLSLTILEYWIRQSLLAVPRALWLKPVLVLAVLNIVPILGLSMWGSALGYNLKDSVSVALLSIVSNVVMTGSSWSSANVFAARNRYYEEWANLQID